LQLILNRGVKHPNPNKKVQTYGHHFLKPIVSCNDYMKLLTIVTNKQTNMDGLYIRNKRKEKGWTQSDLAEKMKVSIRSVARWEEGEYIPEHTKTILQQTLEADDKDIDESKLKPVEVHTTLDAIKEAGSIKVSIGDVQVIVKFA
jgi:DNA-binding transcriptional regulator YiaG